MPCSLLVVILEYNPKPYSIKLYFDVLPASLNVQLRQHYFTRSALKKEWVARIGFETSRCRPPVPLKRVNLVIKRVCKRFMDFDGAVASMKGVVDSLVICGIMHDDSYDVTGPWVVTQERGSTGLFIEVREVTP